VGEYVVYAANDTVLDPDCIQAAYLASVRQNKALVSFHDGPVYGDEGNICTHFLIRKDWIQTIDGEIFDTQYHHCCVDNLLWAKAKKANQAMRCEAAKFVHNHFSNGAEMDEVYKKGWAHVEEDRARLKVDLAKLYASE